MAARRPAAALRERRVDDRHRRPRQRGCDLRRRARLGREVREPVTHELLQARRNRQLVRRIEPLAALGEGARDLECEVEISAGCAPDARDRPPRQRHPEPGAQQLVELVRAQTAQVQPLEALLREGAIEGERHLGPAAATGAEDADPLVLEAPHGERERVLGGRIEPVDVIDRQQGRLLRREAAQQPEQAQADGALQRLGPLGLGAQQRHLERAALRVRQVRHRRLRNVGEEVAQRGVRELRLALDRPAAQDPQAALGGGREALIPERRLADADLALEQECGWAGADRAEKLLDPRELRIATDERRLRDLGQSASSQLLIVRWEPRMPCRSQRTRTS